MISVIGLGKVGLPLVASFLNAKYKVLGIDYNKKLVSNLINGFDHYPEEKVNQIIKANKFNLRFSSDFITCKKISFFFIIVPTPSLSNNSFSNLYVIKAIKNILKFSSKKKIYIILNSTVLPGTIDKIIIPLINKNKKKNSLVEFIYSPLFIALGDVYNGIVNPKSLLLGYDKINLPRNIYKIFIKILNNKNISIFALSYKEAEIAKLVSNCIDATKVSLANLIGLICDNNPQTNSDKINLFLESRISNKINFSGTSYGGPCWPRDNKALVYSMKKNLKKFSLIANSVDKFNNLHKSYLFQKTLKIIKGKKKIFLFGIGYKPGTNNIEESFSYKLLKFLKAKKKTINVFDENFKHTKNKIIKDLNIQLYNNINKVNLINTEVIILSHKKKNLSLKMVKKLLKKNIVIIDYWRLYNVSHENYYKFA